MTVGQQPIKVVGCDFLYKSVPLNCLASGILTQSYIGSASVIVKKLSYNHYTPPLPSAELHLTMYSIHVPLHLQHLTINQQRQNQNINTM